jgi:hypothetical protein
MNTNSLAFRLFATAAAWVLLVLPVAGAIIYSLYRTEVETSFDRRLSVLLTVILQDGIDHGEDEPGDPKDVGEPLFEITHSGWYWQVQAARPQAAALPSRPTAKAAIPKAVRAEGSAHAEVPFARGAGSAAAQRLQRRSNDREIRWANSEGPLQQWLRIAETNYVFGEGKKAKRLLRSPSAARSARWRRASARSAPAVAVAGAGRRRPAGRYLFQIRFGLLPLHKVEQGLAAIAQARRFASMPDCRRRSSRCSTSSMRSSSPTRRSSSAHARTSATSRHALKTPLAVMVQRSPRRCLAPGTQGRRAGRADAHPGQPLPGAGPHGRPHRRDRPRHRGRAGRRDHRARPGTHLPRPPAHLHVDCPAGTRFQGERQDLEEMLGNLLDNAAKWARTKVLLTAVPTLPNGAAGTPTGSRSASTTTAQA